MKKMYNLSITKNGYYSNCALSIIFDEYNTSFSSNENNIIMRWQTDKDKDFNYWYSGRFEISVIDYELLKIANKIYKLLTKETHGKFNLNLLETIEILEANGYKEVKYNRANGNYMTEKEWDDGHKWGIYFGNSLEYSVTGTNEDQAIKKAIKKAGECISKQENLTGWAEWLNNPEVKLLEQGKQWQSGKAALLTNNQ